MFWKPIQQYLGLISCRDEGSVNDVTVIAGVGIQLYIDTLSQVKEQGEREG